MNAFLTVFMLKQVFFNVFTNILDFLCLQIILFKAIKQTTCLYANLTYKFHALHNLQIRFSREKFEIFQMLTC